MSLPSDLDALRSRWTTLYTHTLPSAARSHDPAQPTWPVHADHCFARIVLDNVVVGAVRPWMNAVDRPAVKNMDANQLAACIKLGERILEGCVDLRELNDASLAARGKLERKYGDVESPQKRKATEEKGERAGVRGKKARSDMTQSELPFKSTQARTTKADRDGIDDVAALKQKHDSLLSKIAATPSLTAYRKRLYSTLLSVPEGRYTTYAAMSDYLDSSARAVGNGMRNNPFAPDVPCHRVLAADGSIGGFCGDWGKDGKHAGKKVDLLRSEGVRFDSRGKVIGRPFRDLKDLSAT